MLRKKSSGTARATRLTQALSPAAGGSLDRRTFLARSGLLTGGVALASVLPLGAVQEGRRGRVQGRCRPAPRASNRSAPIVRSDARSSPK